MSSEERWIRIENALQTVAERQSLHDAQIAQNAVAIRDLFVHSEQTDQRLRVLAQNMIDLVYKVDDLSNVVRSRDDTLNDHDSMMTELARKIDILVDTVDRLIRRNNNAN